MIAIVCAMVEERDAFINLMNNFKIEYERKISYHDGKLLDNRYYIGEVNGVKVVVCRVGIGKVYAAIGTSLLIEKYKPELVINLGVAGSTNPEIKLGDVVVADRVADWEVDIPKWERSIYSPKISYACDNKIIQLSEGYNDTEPKIKVGNIVSGDEFVRKKSQLNTIKKYFPEALCVDMEAGSIANTCFAFNTPVSIIRSISDDTMMNKNYDAHEFNLEESCRLAAKFCARIINGY